MDDEYEGGETVTLEDLLDDGRYEDVAHILADIGPDEPDGPAYMALRAVCLLALKREDQALRVALQAVAADRTSGFGHWVLGSVLAERNRFADALVEAQQAVALEPGEARNHALLAQVHAGKGSWDACRAAAQQGLAIEPDDEACRNFLALANLPLGSAEERAAEFESLMERFPASSYARAGRAWSVLERGRAADARADFEQALALDPTSEWARRGLAESIKAHNPVYAAILRVVLRFERLPGGARWGIILGGIFLVRLLRTAARTNPAIQPFVYPVIGLWLLFIVLSWVVEPLSNFILARTLVGRRLVTVEDRLEANVITALLGFGIAAGVFGMATGLTRPISAGLAAAALVVPVRGIFLCRPGWPRTIMQAWTFLTALAATAAAVGPPDLAGAALGTALLLAVLATWLTAFLSTRTPAR